MANQRSFDLVSVRRAIETCGASPAAIARELGCTRSTVYAYLRKYPELKAAFEAARGSGVAERTQYTREQFEQAIELSFGIKATVATMVGCSRATVDNALERWPDLAIKLENARGQLVSAAVSSLAADVVNSLSQRHQQAYMFVLKTLGKDEGFTERREVTGADGAALLDLSPEALRMIQRMGLDMSEVTRQFETMVRAAAAAQGISE